MKLLVIIYSDDLAAPMPNGTSVSVNDGSTTLEGKVFTSLAIDEPNPSLIPHTHPIVGIAGEPQE